MKCFNCIKLFFLIFTIHQNINGMDIGFDLSCSSDFVAIKLRNGENVIESDIKQLLTLVKTQFHTNNESKCKVASEKFEKETKRIDWNSEKDNNENNKNFLQGIKRLETDQMIIEMTLYLILKKY